MWNRLFSSVLAVIIVGTVPVVSVVSVVPIVCIVKTVMILRKLKLFHVVPCCDSYSIVKLLFY